MTGKEKRSDVIYARFPAASRRSCRERKVKCSEDFHCWKPTPWQADTRDLGFPLFAARVRRCCRVPSHIPTHTAPPNRSIFNRKDLFTQHLKRMHTEIKDLLNATGANTINSSKKPSFHKPKPTPAAVALLTK